MIEITKIMNYLKRTNPKLFHDIQKLQYIKQV